jgi:hypothetical protein
MLSRQVPALIAAATTVASLSIGPIVTARELPTVGEQPVVASVNGEPVYIDDLLWSLANLHSEMGGEARPARSETPDEVLDRLIDVELIAQESRSIGLDTLPDYRNAREARRLRVLRDLVLQRGTGEVPEPSAREVETAYRSVMLRVRMHGFIASTEDEAAAFRTAVADGGDFAAIARDRPDFQENQMISPEGWLTLSSIYPSVAEAVAETPTGGLTEVVEVPGEGWAVVRVLDTDLPEVPDERAAARDRVVAKARATVRRAYIREVSERHATMTDPGIEAIDFESGDPPFDILIQDDRPLATFDNAEPVTVADVANGLRTRFFHGPDKAAARGDLNEKKSLVFDDLVGRRSLELEAARLGIDASPEFRSEMRFFDSAALFGMFVDRVITRDLRAYREDLERTYRKHRERFATPARVVLQQLVFRHRDGAEAALARLRRGADFDWVRSNTAGVVTGEELQEYWKFPERAIQEETLPENVRSALESASQGDYRMAVESDRAYHVLKVVDRTPSFIPSFEDVRAQLGPIALAEMRDQALREYIEALRDASEIEIFARGDELRDVVMEALGRPQ